MILLKTFKIKSLKTGFIFFPCQNLDFDMFILAYTYTVYFSLDSNLTQSPRLDLLTIYFVLFVIFMLKVSISRLLRIVNSMLKLLIKT